jgi:hypothetical protein
LATHLKKQPIGCIIEMFMPISVYFISIERDGHKCACATRAFQRGTVGEECVFGFEPYISPENASDGYLFDHMDDDLACSNMLIYIFVHLSP